MAGENTYRIDFKIHMKRKKAGLLSCFVGILLILVPVSYRDSLMDIGVAPVLDPIRAVGLGGGYPIGVGSAAVAIGISVVCHKYIEQPATTIFLVSEVIGAILGVIAIHILLFNSVVGAIQIGLAGAAPGFASVRGAATEQIHRNLSMALVICLLSPFAVPQIFRGATYDGLGGFISYVIVIAIIVYTAVLSYPFFKLGRCAQ